MHARYVILRVLLENGRGVVKVERTTGPDGDDIIVRLDKNKIETDGKSAIEDFLQKLQVRGNEWVGSSGIHSECLAIINCNMCKLYLPWLFQIDLLNSTLHVLVFVCIW